MRYLDFNSLLKQQMKVLEERQGSRDWPRWIERGHLRFLGRSMKARLVLDEAFLSLI